MTAGASAPASNYATMLIDYRYFIHPKTRIAGIDTTKDGKPTDAAERIINDITAYIKKYEPRYLRMLLGPQYQAILDADKTIKAMLVDPNTGTSVIADYVYFYYLRDFSTANTMAGEKIKIADNSERSTAAFRLVTLWNEMVRESICIVKSITHPDVKPDYDMDIFNPINPYGL